MTTVKHGSNPAERFLVDNPNATCLAWKQLASEFSLLLTWLNSASARKAGMTPKCWVLSNSPRARFGVTMTSGPSTEKLIFAGTFL